MGFIVLVFFIWIPIALYTAKVAEAKGVVIQGPGSFEAFCLAPLHCLLPLVGLI